MAIGDGKNGFVTVPVGGAAMVQPPSGEEWLVRDIANTSSNGFPYNTDIGLYDGTLYSCIRRSLFSEAWLRKLVLFISNTVYLRIVSSTAGAGPFVVSYSAIVTNVGGTSAGRADAKLNITNLAASAYFVVQPPSGETWSMMELGSNDFDVTYNEFPNVAFSSYDGTNGTYIYLPNINSYTRPWRAILSHSIYGRIQNLAASTQAISYSAIRMS